jgi:hypothetical protein
MLIVRYMASDGEKCMAQNTVQVVQVIVLHHLCLLNL